MRWVDFLPLAALLPLGAAFVNRMFVMLAIGVSGAIFLGAVIWESEAVSAVTIASYGPIFLLLGALSFVTSRKQESGTEGDGVVADEDFLQGLKRRQNLLKSEVSALEKEESQALQIYGVAKSLAEALSWKEMAPRLTSAIQKVFGAYEFLIYALDDQGGWNLLHRRGGWAQEPPIQGELPDDVRFFHPPHSSEVVPVLTIPIFAAGPSGPQIKGTLFMKSPIGEKSEADLTRSGREFGEQLGMTLNKALLFSQMEEHSRVDGLTGVLRRQSFMERMAEEVKRARVFNTPFSVMMVDIDLFKAVNDEHGHAAGDAVLRRLGELLKTSIYETDFVGRYGGEEFILLLPKAQAEGALRKAELLRQRIEQDSVASGFERLRFTVSIGVSHCPRHGVTADDLIRAADQALYQAKASGRNRVAEA